jgi:hypothetical protein
MIYLTGSRALNFWFPEVVAKSTTDWDIVSDQDVDSKLVDPSPQDLNSFEICQIYNSDKSIETPVGFATIVSPTGLMLFKRSHLHRPINFSKHIKDYHFLKSKVSNLDEVYYRLLGERIKLTKEKYKDNVLSLNQNKDDFFDDYVPKQYEHDSIHYATCYGEKPIYEELKTDDKKVWCSKKKWEDLPHQKKINCVREEAFVIALERYIIPKIEKHPPAKFAFDWALERICTNLTSGWFREFAIENWPEIRSHDYDFLSKFLTWKDSLNN